MNLFRVISIVFSNLPIAVIFISVTFSTTYAYEPQAIDNTSQPIQLAARFLTQGQQSMKNDCEFSGGRYKPYPGLGVCCWDNWGCLTCRASGCTMKCETKRCREVNAQVVQPGDDSEQPITGRPSVPQTERKFQAVTPTQGTSVVLPSGQEFHFQQESEKR
jgi:hypothetical protein